MIKRWSLENGMMLSDDCGQFVDIEDYERLEAELKHCQESEGWSKMMAMEGWKETAAQHLRNKDYYRGLVQEVGKHFGADAYISDDGSIQQDILCAKVPDLVARMNERVWELESERTLFQEYVAKNPKVMEDAEREMELTERICELEAERDRLSTDLSESLQKQIQMALDALLMKNRHAALVEAAELLSSMVGAMMVRMTYCREILMATKMPSNKVLSMLDITTDKEIYDEITTKAALAEVNK